MGGIIGTLMLYTKRKMRRNNMKGFRCPNCGQAQELNVQGVQIKMNEEMDTMTFQKEGKDISPMTVIPNENIQCHKCLDQSFMTEDWIEAFEDPLKFFEMEELCHCGGELWMDKIPGTTSFGFVCEKCEWVKPRKRVSGA